MRVDIGKECPRIADSKFWQISTELRPLIGVRNWFSLSRFGIFLLIFFKLGIRVDFEK